MSALTGSLHGITPTVNKKPPLNFAKLFFPNLQRELVGEMLKAHGDFLLRRAADGGRVLSVNKNGELVHFKFGGQEDRKIVMEGRSFDTLEAMVTHYYESGSKVTGRGEVELLTPILNTVDLIEYSRLNFLQELGRGNFGQVWRANLSADPSSKSSAGAEEVAVKILAANTSDRDRAECMAEARLMGMFDHENVVRLKGLCFWSESGPGTPPKLVIVLEYCNLGSLDKLLETGMVLGRGKEKALWDTAKGVEYLHSCKVIHRDLASRNCLVQKPPHGTRFTTKVADFGLSRLVDTTYKLVTKRRLPVFSTAPETLKTREWTFASDVWSFGVLMMETYNGGKNPYDGHYGATPLKQIVTELLDGFRLPMAADMPAELAQLTQRCLNKAPDRPKMSEVVTDLTRFYNRNSPTNT